MVRTVLLEEEIYEMGTECAARDRDLGGESSRQKEEQDGPLGELMNTDKSP